MDNRPSFVDAFSNIPTLDRKIRNSNEIKYDDFLIRQEHFQRQQRPLTLRVLPRGRRRAMTTMMVAQSHDQIQGNEHDDTWTQQKNNQSSFNKINKRLPSETMNYRHEDEHDILHKLHQSVDSWSMKIVIPWMIWIVLLVLTMVTAQTTIFHWSPELLLPQEAEPRQILFVVSTISALSSFWFGILVFSWRKTMMGVVTNALEIQQSWDKGHYEWGRIFSECRNIAHYFASTKIRYYHDYDKYKNQNNEKIHTIDNDDNKQQQQQQQQQLLRQLADALWSFPKSVEFHLEQESLGLKNDGKNDPETIVDDEMTEEEAVAANFAEQVQLVLSEDVSSSTLLVQDLIGAQDKPNRSLEEVIYIVDALVPFLLKQQKSNSPWKPERTDDIPNDLEYHQDHNHNHDAIIANAISSLGDAVATCEESVQNIYYHSRSFEAATEDATKWSKKMIGSLLLLFSMSMFSLYPSVDWFHLEGLTYNSGSSTMMTEIPLFFTGMTIIYCSSFVLLLTIILEQLMMQVKVPQRSFFASIPLSDDTRAIERNIDLAAWEEFAIELHENVDASSQQTEKTEDILNSSRNSSTSSDMIPPASSENGITSTAGLSSFIIPRSDLSEDIVSAVANNSDPCVIKSPMKENYLSGQASSLISGSGTFTIPTSEAVALSELLNIAKASTNMTVNGRASSPYEGALTATRGDTKGNCPNVSTTASSEISSIDDPREEEIESFLDESLEGFLKNQAKREA